MQMTTKTVEVNEPPGPQKAAGTFRERIQEVLGPTDEEWNDWKWHFKNRFNTVGKLARVMPLDRARKKELEVVGAEYPFSITPYYLSLARTGARNDPVLIQAVPSLSELLHPGVGEEDPLNEEGDSPVPGLVHRYPDRALLVITDVCPTLCRHCTRKREWRGEHWWMRDQSRLAAAFEYIRRTPAIRDVIVSGGDPLTVCNEGLEAILAELRSISHVEIIRFGSRFPVVLPQRIDEGFVKICDKYGPIWLNTHFNHPNEVTPEAERAVRELLRAGVSVGNQTVLLRGINDSVETQLKLSHELLKIRVRPYYLFHADDVRGTEHLRTSVEAGIGIIEGMRGHTSGLGIPTFVVDVPGGGGKIPLQPNYVLSWTDDCLLLRNYERKVFEYRNPRPARSDNRRSKAGKPAARRNGRNGGKEPAKVDVGKGAPAREAGRTNGHRAASQVSAVD